MYVDMHNEAETRVGYILYSWCPQWNESSGDKLDPCLEACRFGDKFRFFQNKSENLDQRTFVSASYLVDYFAPDGDVCGKCISFRPF